MITTEQFDMAVILSCIKTDIKKQRYIILWNGFISLFLIFVIFPIAIWYVFLIVSQSIMFMHPGHSLRVVFQYKNYFLIYYDNMMVFYFLLMYFKNKKLHIKKFRYYKKALIFALLAFIVSLIPAYYLVLNSFIVIVYFTLFIMSLYYLSYIYNDVLLQETLRHLQYASNHLNPEMRYKNSYDNPTINYIDTTYLGFDIVIVFLRYFLNTISFFYAIRYQRYIQESVRMFDFILENNFKNSNEKFSYHALNILILLNYISIRSGKVRLPKKGLEVARKAKKELQYNFELIKNNDQQKIDSVNDIIAEVVNLEEGDTIYIDDLDNPYRFSIEMCNGKCIVGFARYYRSFKKDVLIRYLVQGLEIFKKIYKNPKAEGFYIK